VVSESTGFDQLLVGGAATVVEAPRRGQAMGLDSVMVRRIVGDHAPSCCAPSSASAAT
jgi:hypothetical protein